MVISKLIHLPVSIKRLALIAGIALLLLFLLGYANRLLASIELSKQVGYWEAEVQLAEQQVQASQAMLAHAHSDKFVIEKAHSELGWAFPGEVPVHVAGQQPNTPVAGATPEAGDSRVPYWRQWWQRLMGR